MEQIGMSKEYSEEFDKLRKNRVEMSFYKYGPARKNFATGNVIDEFYSMHVASKITGIPQPNIHKVCNGVRKTAGGYKWRYKDEY